MHIANLANPLSDNKVYRFVSFRISNVYELVTMNQNGNAKLAGRILFNFPVSLLQCDMCIDEITRVSLNLELLNIEH